MSGAQDGRLFGRRTSVTQLDNFVREAKLPIAGASDPTQAADRRSEYEASSSGNFRCLAMSAMQCAAAHFYLVPGLKFQRFRVILGVKSLFWRKRLHASTLTMALHRTPPLHAYLGFHFASRFLTNEALGDYLDVSSPWLFPVALLSQYEAASATLLSVEASRLQNLLGAAKARVAGAIRCESSDQRLDNAAYDTITSLWGGEDSRFGTSNIKELWRVLKPGGTLLLSAPCAGSHGEAIAQSSDELDSADRVHPYDSRMLERRLFAVVGQPRRYAIYGAQPATPYRSTAAEEASAWHGDSLAIGRHWRCYANLQELPAIGVIVMKFVRPPNGSHPNPLARE
jgi:hypothetical protein